MPRQDINGNNFNHYLNFPNDPMVKNIEFAAGKTFFGKMEFPNCYLTDIAIPPIEHFMNFPQDYENHDCHYIDQQCDYYKLNIGAKRFDNIIFCNPFEVGFRGRFETKDFLETAHTMLSEDGTVIVLGSSTNQWSQYRNLNRHYNYLIESNNLAYKFTFEFQTIDETHPYRHNHQFYITDLSTFTIPNELIKIKRAN
ncbi:hypothetical protein ACFQ3S_09875 [Mucilaginibacter terrae]|uniref:hypothetical protein n=1 Tax=Mucilaginibacter terrae TaxID=1955052 RepID=UPI00363BD76A